MKRAASWRRKGQISDISVLVCLGGEKIVDLSSCCGDLVLFDGDATFFAYNICTFDQSCVLQPFQMEFYVFSINFQIFAPFRRVTVLFFHQ